MDQSDCKKFLKIMNSEGKVGERRIRGGLLCEQYIQLNL